MGEVIRSGACPRSFQARCNEARRGGRNGGYRHAGYLLACELPHFGPLDVHEDDRFACIDELLAYLYHDEGDDRVPAWPAAHLSRCWGRIPARSRGRFLDGLLGGVLAQASLMRPGGPYA